MIKSEELRLKWQEFWKQRDHDIIASAPLVPINDDTLLWINSGVAPLKKYFDGRVIPTNRRMSNIQKCIRTNDIENVGFTRRHATFFEMMGNFSIGDYFKKEAIQWSYEFLTEWALLDKDKLYVTIYPNDEEAYNAWIKVGMPEDRIIRLEGNFWEIGAGPSGPDSEIFYDRGPKYDPENIGLRLLSEEIENDRYMEVWNNVFSMYNANPEVSRDKYEELPSKNIDTGMGFERILMIMQEKDSIFETDVFEPIIKKIEILTGENYCGQVPFRAIADHVRTVTFALADGANFGNSGRDYVLRRLLRRAVRFGKKLGLEKPFMFEIVEAVIEKMTPSYSYLESKKEMIMTKVRKEEELFHLTLAQGEKKFKEMVDNSVDKKISGSDAFKLYDTYGFPFELTEEMASDIGFTISRSEFDEYMNIQKENAKAARITSGSMNMQNENLLNFKVDSKFVGYDKVETEARVIALFDGTSFIESASEGYFVLDETPFYAESGGQVSDFGEIVLNDYKINVLSIFKGPNKQHFHYFKGDVNLTVGESVIARIDLEKRLRIMKNHSSVHLIQKALKEMFGESVAQAGSYVDDEYARFDFTVDARITGEDIVKIENMVNEKIKIDNQTKTEILNINEAIETGATALFEDKYESVVRVVTIADSKEFCGGTHVKNVSDIEKVAITNFESKGNNTYRIDVATSINVELELYKAIKPYNENMIKLLTKARKIINAATNEGIVLDFSFDIDSEAPKSYSDVMHNMDEMEKLKMEVQKLDKSYLEEKIKLAIESIFKFEDQIEIIGSKRVLIMKTDNYEIDVLKEIISNIANKYNDILIFIANIKDGNVNYLARTNLKELNVGQLVKEASVKSLGNGGGSPSFAQGGGTDTTEVENILINIRKVVIEK